MSDSKREEQRKRMLHARSKQTGPHPRKGKHLNRRIYKLTKKMMKKAIPGSKGIISKIAQRIPCNPGTIRNKLTHPDWQDIRALIEEEKEAVLDLAEDVLIKRLKADADEPYIAFQTARYLLDRKGFHRGYKKQEKVTVEAEHTVKNISTDDVDISKLSLETRIRLMNEIENRADVPKKIIRVTEIEE